MFSSHTLTQRDENLMLTDKTHERITVINIILLINIIWFLNQLNKDLIYHKLTEISSLLL